MNWNQQQLGQMPEPDIILHIGAGLCSELPDYQRVAPNQIVLVEPNPETFAELQAQAAGWDNVTVLQAAVTDRTGRASLRLFNFPELDSLREPVGLYKLLPGLRQVGRAEVSTLSAQQLIEQLPLKTDGHNWLVLEAPGEELTILTALAECQALERFSRLIVRAGSENFYDGTPSSSPAVLDALEQRGYTTQARADISDADWPRHHLRLDRMALECKRLKAELAAQKKHEQDHRADLMAMHKALGDVKQVLLEAEKARTEAEQARAQAEEQQKAQLVQNQQLESALTEQKTTSEKLGTELHERKKDLARLTQARDEAQQKLTEAEKNLADLPEQQKRLKALEEESTNLRAQLEAKAKQAEDLQTTLQSHKQELATAKDQRAKLTEQLESAQQKLTKAETESKSLRQQNDELQKKYRQLEQEYQRKEALIDEEFLKAESQLELIKELVFRDKPV